MDWFTIAAVSACIGWASFFANVAGFGFALVSIPLLALVLPLKEAIVLILVITVLQRAITMWRTRSGFDWSTVLTVTAGSFVGSIPGSLVLRLLELNVLEIFLGTVLLAATILMSLERTVTIKSKLAGRFGAGFFSGFFGAATSVSGPPLALYFLNERTNKEAMRANMIWIFGLSGFITVLVSYAAGNISVTHNWLLVAASFPAMLLGLFAGEKMFYRLNQHLFRRLALIAVLVGAVTMLFNGLRVL